MNVTERSKERPQRLFGDQWRQPTNEDSCIVRVRGGQLFTVWSYKIAQDRASLRLMLP